MEQTQQQQQDQEQKDTQQQLDQQQQPEEVKESKQVKQLDPLFVNLEENTPSEEIESMCMSCQGQGVTRFLFTKIPFFKGNYLVKLNQLEIILSSFECKECGWKNTEVQFGGKLADFGVRYELKVVDSLSMNRSLVKSENATIRIPELDFEVPPQTQKGSINTIEGIFQKSIEGLQELQEERRQIDAETAGKIDEFIQKLRDYADGKVFPFTLILEDPSGNSYIQNPNAPKKDNYCTSEFYPRSADDYINMGYNADLAQTQAEKDAEQHKEYVLKQNQVTEAPQQIPQDGPQQIPQEVPQQIPQQAPKEKKKKQKAKQGMTEEEQKAFLKKMEAYAVRDKQPEIIASHIDFSKPLDEQIKEGAQDDVKKEVMQFPTYCYSCSLEGNAKMCIATIPFFKEIIIMAFSCDYCGYRNTEIKQGGGISENATRIVFKVEKAADMNRDVFKSDSSIVAIPELDFAMSPGTLGGVYTTVEGLLDKILTNLEDNNPFGMGDSATNDTYMKFLDKLRDYKDFKQKFTLILDDALSNCFIYNPFAPEDDPQIEITIYDRTEEQNEELGLNDMNV